MAEVSTDELTAATIASWMKRVDAEGPDVLVQLCEPVNKFPDLVRHVVRRLRVLSPTMGTPVPRPTRRLRQTPCRVGTHRNQRVDETPTAESVM